MSILLHILILAAAIFAISMALPAIKIKNFWTAIIVAIVYSLVNFFLGWLFFLLSLPLIILTLGLFKIVINAVMLKITDWLVPGFEIKGFGWTMVAAVLIAVVDMVVRAVL